MIISVYKLYTVTVYNLYTVTVYNLYTVTVYNLYTILKDFFHVEKLKFVWNNDRMDIFSASS